MLLQQQMREKAKVAGSNKFGLAHVSSMSSTAAASAAKATAVTGIFKTQMTDALKENQRESPEQALPVPAPTSQKKVLRATPVRVMASQRSSPNSPFDTYEMSDGEEFSVDSDDEEAREQRANKYIPLWARAANLRVLLEKQHHRTDDPDDTFFRVTTCDLEAIFGVHPNKRHYNTRNSTGDWGDDRSQPLNHLVPKRAGMGY